MLEIIGSIRDLGEILLVRQTGQIMGEARHSTWLAARHHTQQIVA